MRQIKCRRCKNKTPQESSYKIIHVTKTGNEQNRYYCSENCYREEEKEIFMLKQCQYAVDHILGYTCINNAKNTNIKEIVAAGYSREELFDCMMELKDYIMECLNYRQDIESEYQKIQYMFAIVKGQIKEITEKNKLKINNKQEEVYEEVEIVQSTPASTNKKQSLWDKLGVK